MADSKRIRAINGIEDAVWYAVEEAGLSRAEILEEVDNAITTAEEDAE
jgi:hypothetical protein